MNTRLLSKNVNRFQISKKTTEDIELDLNFKICIVYDILSMKRSFIVDL